MPLPTPLRPLPPADATLPLPERVRRMDPERLRKYAENLAFYQGEQWPSRARRNERRLTFNYARAFADKATSYLLNGLVVQVEPIDGDEALRGRARAAERALREVERHNALAQLDFETELDCAVLGDAAYRVTWDTAAREVRVSAPDVQGIFAWRQPDDPARIMAVASQYPEGPAPPVGTPTPLSITEYWGAGVFERWRGNDLVERMENPYGFVPFVLFPNVREPKEPWGSSDLPPLMESNRELNRAFSQLSHILELCGNPIAVLENVTGAADIVVEPGAVWEMPERSRAYLLDLIKGGGLGHHRDYIDLVYRTLHDLGESPRSAFGHNPQGLSGVALNTELDPLAKKVARKRLIRTSVYERRASMILALLGRYGGVEVEGVRPVVQWGPVLPIDRSRQVAEERSMVEAGIASRRTAAARLGLDDPEAEWARVREERG